MRLKIILALFFLALLSTFAFAQDGGGKPLPGEGTPTVTPLALDEPTATLTEAADSEPSATPTEAADIEPTDDDTQGEIDEDFPADMLEETGLDINDAELVLYEPFDDEDAWELYEGDTGNLRIEDGVYIIESDDTGVLWGQNLEEHSDVVIQVTTEQLSREDNNGFGIMCRANPDNNLEGYHLWISGDGFATIFRFEDGGDEYVDMEEWATTDAINQGRDTNVITAVCVGEYIGLFVNGELAVETEDDTYSEGVAGFSAYVFEEGEDVEIAFDDVYIWAVGDAAASNNDTDEDQQADEDNTNDSFGELDVDAAEEDVVDALEQGDVAIELGDLMTADDFSEAGDWGVLDEDTSLIEVDNGVYFFEEEGELLFQWSQNYAEEEYEDVVIRLDTAQISEDEANGYGVMCRLDTEGEGDGYMFFITGDGYYNIGYWLDDEYTSIVDFTESELVNTGQDQNTLYAVCVGEYLALYVNGELVDEVEDDTFESGFTGMGVVSFSGEPVTVEFDNLYVWEAND